MAIRSSSSPELNELLVVVKTQLTGIACHTYTTSAFKIVIWFIFLTLLCDCHAHLFNMILHSNMYLSPRMALESSMESYPCNLIGLLVLLWQVNFVPQMIHRNMSTQF